MRGPSVTNFIGIEIVANAIPMDLENGSNSHKIKLAKPMTKITVRNVLCDMLIF